MHGSQDGGGVDIVEWSRHFLEAYREAQLPRLSSSKRVATQWSPPMENAVKINVDVGFMDAEFFQVARNRDGACS